MNKKLTIEEAKEFSKNFINKISNDESRQFQILHSKHVAEIALILAMNKNVDKEILEIAGYVHDIGYAIEEKNHAEHSLEILEKEFEINDKLKDCILNHGNSGKPLTEEGKIVQIADKVSLFNPETISLILRLNKNKIKKEDINFIKMMADHAINMLEEFDI